MWRSHHPVNIGSMPYKTKTALAVLKALNWIFLKSFLWRLICVALKTAENDFLCLQCLFHPIHAILIDKEHRDWIPIYTGYPDASCSTRKNRNWCKRKSGYRITQDCFFVCTTFDSFLNDLCGWCNSRQSSIRAPFAVACSSGMAEQLFTKVKRRFFRPLWPWFAAICNDLPTVVKLPGFYYVLTTNRCRNLPHFALFCHFTHFSWQNVSAESLRIIEANRGIRRQIEALERRFLHWSGYYSFATAISADHLWQNLLWRNWSGKRGCRIISI